jgi:hypothetical protein
VTLSMNGFTVPPGGEEYMCQVFANPFSGANTDILRVHNLMSVGSHRFFVFSLGSVEAAVEPAVGTVGACRGNGLEFHPFVSLSQQPDWDVSFPAAPDCSPMGYPVPGSNSLMLFAHYLNTSTTGINVTAQATLYPAKSGVVTTHVGNILLNQRSMSVPANTPMATPVHTIATWTGDTALPPNYTIITSWNHMVTRALGITATTGGSAFYTETNWDSPLMFVHAQGTTEPATATGSRTPVQMTNTSSITWDCAYYNTNSTALSFGDSAVNNVWCVYLAQYYPASTTTPDIIYNY